MGACLLQERGFGPAPFLLFPVGSADFGPDSSPTFRQVALVVCVQLGRRAHSHAVVSWGSGLSTPTTVRLPDPLKQRVAERAAVERRTFSNLLVCLVEDALLERADAEARRARLDAEQRATGTEDA